MKIVIQNSSMLCLFLMISSCASSNRIKILPIGDSTTCASQYKLSYRYPLWKRLVDTGTQVEFVGSQTQKGNGGRVWTDYKGLKFPSANEGHSGWRTDQILKGLPNGEKGLDTWLMGYHPDIALIHLGTNDTYQLQTPESTRDEIKQLILKLRAKNPNIKVLLAKILPMKANIVVPQLNQLLGLLATELNQAHSPVVSVDMYSGFDIHADLQKDQIHPSAKGEEKMAQRWFDALIENRFLKREF